MVKCSPVVFGELAWGLISFLVVAQPTPARAQPSPLSPAAAAHLLAAYPDALDRIDGNELVWRDATRMPITDGRHPKTAKDVLQNPDIVDMLATPYPAAAPLDPPLADVDPGRARPTAFFDKLYGNCRSGEVAAHLVDIVWLPRKAARPVKFTHRHGAARALEAVSARLDSLPARFDAYLTPPVSTYVCRTIEGTNRPSAHGHGIAIDIAIPYAHYWRWSKPTSSAGGAYRNAIPMEIVAAFEAEGFIWGGRWHHYDTMHFEYRPELRPTNAHPP